MKLLSKQDVIKLKTTERLVDVQEGAKLAKKIDLLRQTASNEETKLSKFRDESLRLIKEDITRNTVTRDDLVDQVNHLIEEKRQLQIPLDAEWDKVNIRTKELDKEVASLATKKLQLKKSIDSYNKDVESLEFETSRIASERVVINKQLDEVVQNYDKAKSDATKADIVRQGAEKYLIEVNKELLGREAKLAVRERDVSLLKSYLEKKKMHLNDRERFINDKYQTLLRAQQHGRKRKA